MRTRVNKLRLSAETLRNLDHVELQLAAGGQTPFTQLTVCRVGPTYQTACLGSCHGCNTNGTCTTTFC
jgi:hypothetical protein